MSLPFWVWPGLHGLFQHPSCLYEIIRFVSLSIYSPLTHFLFSRARSGCLALTRMVIPMKHRGGETRVEVRPTLPAGSRTSNVLSTLRSTLEMLLLMPERKIAVPHHSYSLTGKTTRKNVTFYPSRNCKPCATRGRSSNVRPRRSLTGFRRTFSTVPTFACIVFGSS